MAWSVPRLPWISRPATRFRSNLAGERDVRDDLDDLATRMKAGEERAFVEFADEVGPWLRRRFLARGLSSADAEAMAVSAVSDVVMRLGKFATREGGGFRTWVWTVALNTYRDQARKRGPGLLEDAEALADPGRFDPFPEEEDGVALALVAAVREGIEGLGEPDRIIVRCKLDDPDRTYGDIGESMGMKPGTVRVRHHRALLKLANVLKDQVAVRKWRGREDVLGSEEDEREAD
ncbi:MAG: RNA polymerase sigma factor [Isosphaeraceae bacterium]